ncbi:hypothetical protein BTHERMOSOX_276 [Bathymodiolus thermophilus thioautotrophic gill symbiont]|uniref:Uncharacterized protein n=1 Tax=Bathymodiolus thermophilus thioautotrophic gill symbiont TaxID=2360 RepID=A0A8H9CFX8_9GAMM|nr:hypothetical protein [Bathymodiolus thermophilus thioautotrophic gill symbiont]CAB5494311.1 hypothetical protein THERMOT_86 [Bathymodiolus thermophilus thioautotrophic gill symbiont]CAB5499621.1 hypothetical protein THERMOS_1050 [Bathymodiolus thermophilus thioautotrophic gill symbiont]SHA30978.1 hypothetical protein BTHERMOSOX_276 [Bathymodiolus thermophilus thioautotrophic gill symbiont]
MFNLKKILTGAVIATGLASSGISMANSNSSPAFLQNTGSLAMSESSMQKVKGAGFLSDVWTVMKVDIKIATHPIYAVKIARKLLNGDVKGAEKVMFKNNVEMNAGTLWRNSYLYSIKKTIGLIPL